MEATADMRPSTYAVRKDNQQSEFGLVAGGNTDNQITNEQDMPYLGVMLRCRILGCAYVQSYPTRLWEGLLKCATAGTSKHSTEDRSASVV